MLDKPYIVETEAQQTAVIRLTIPREEIRNVMAPAIGEVFAAQGMTGGERSGRRRRSFVAG